MSDPGYATVGAAVLCTGFQIDRAESGLTPNRSLLFQQSKNNRTNAITETEMAEFLGWIRSQFSRISGVAQI